jgi:hypothetical protein
MSSKPFLIRGVNVYLYYYYYYGWAGHVARIGEKRNECRLLVGNPEGKRPLGRQVVDGWGGVKWAGLVWLRIGTGSCEFGTEPSGSIKCWETIEWPNNWWPLE